LARRGNTTGPASDGLTLPRQQLVLYQMKSAPAVMGPGSQQNGSWSDLEMSQVMDEKQKLMLERAADSWTRRPGPIWMNVSSCTGALWRKKLTALAVESGTPFPFIPNTAYAAGRCHLERTSDKRPLPALLQFGADRQFVSCLPPKDRCVPAARDLLVLSNSRPCFPGL